MLGMFCLLETEDDRLVIDQLYQKAADKMLVVALKVTKKIEDAEDAVQSAFLKVIGKYKTYKHLPMIDLEKICIVAVRNSAIDLYKKEKTQLRVEIGDYFRTIESDHRNHSLISDIMQKHSSERIREAMAHLSEDDREIIYLKYGIQMKAKDIADIKCMKEANVRKRCMVAKERLQKILSKKEFRDIREDD